MLNVLQAWALGGVTVYGVLSGLNLFWFYKLMLMALAANSPKPRGKATPAVQPSPTAAAVTDITAAAGDVASAAAATASDITAAAGKATAARPCKVLSPESLTGLMHRGKQRAAAIAGMIPHAAAGLQTRLSECLDFTNSPRASMTGQPAKWANSGTASTSVVTAGSPLQKSSLNAADSALQQQAHSRVRQPLPSPFAALAHQHALSRRRFAVSDFGPAVLAQWERRQGLQALSRTALSCDDQQAAAVHETRLRGLHSNSGLVNKADDGERARSSSPSRRRGRCPGNDIWG